MSSTCIFMSDFDIVEGIHIVLEATNVQPIRKPFILDPIFPFELVYKGVRYSENELPDHLHDMYEVVYIHDGMGMFFIDHTLYEKGPGDLFLIPSNTVHRSFPSSAEPIVSTALFFAPSFVQVESLDDHYEPLRCFEIARKLKQYKFSLPEPLRLFIETAIHTIANESEQKASGYRHAVRLQLQLLMLELSRHLLANEPPSSATGFGPQWIQNALRDIHRDPVQCGGLAQLALQANVSASHFSRVFKQHTGMNVTDYVNAKRLIHAKQLLISTDDNIEAIALICGFQGMRYFYQFFRKLTGLTPLSYRRQMK